MTIIDASSKLFNWFCENHSLNLDDPVQAKSVGITDDESFAAFQLAISGFEKLELARPFTNKNGSKIYVMEKDMKNFQQNVSVNGETARMIAEKINTFCETINDKTDWCDPLNITGRDILNLVFIIEFFSKAQEKPEEGKKQKKKSGNIFLGGEDFSIENN